MKNLQFYMNLPYKVMVESVKDEDESYFKVTIPRLPGVLAFGETLEEAMDDLEGAKEVWLKKCLKDGIYIPKSID